MGAVFSAFDDYSLGYLLLAATSAVAGAFTATIVRQRANR
jgi:hypothetical protein